MILKVNPLCKLIILLIIVTLLIAVINSMLFQPGKIRGVNFINILCSNLLPKSASSSFSLVTFWLCNFLAQKYWRKSLTLNVDEIDT